MKHMDEEMMAQAAPQGGEEISAIELEDSMTQDAQEQMGQAQMEEHEALAARVREGIGELFEDGWTAEELKAFSEDPGAKAAIARGHSVARAACAYLRMKLAGSRKRGVPTARTIATGGYVQDNPIEQMTDEQFDAFSRRVHAAMMEGKRVRI